MKTFEKKLATNKMILERLEYLRENGAINENTVLQQEDTTLELESRILEMREEVLQLKSYYDEQKSRIDSDIFINELQIQYETVVAPGNGVIFDSKSCKVCAFSWRSNYEIIPRQTNCRCVGHKQGYWIYKSWAKAKIRVEHMITQNLARL